MPSILVLLVGGPMHGQVVKVDAGARFYAAIRQHPTAVEAAMSGNPRVAGSSIEMETYRITEGRMYGRPGYIGATGSGDADTAEAMDALLLSAGFETDERRLQGGHAPGRHWCTAPPGECPGGINPPQNDSQAVTASLSGNIRDTVAALNRIARIATGTTPDASSRPGHRSRHRCGPDGCWYETEQKFPRCDPGNCILAGRAHP